MGNTFSLEIIKIYSVCLGNSRKKEQRRNGRVFNNAQELTSNCVVL